jgi:hypothetical protein
MLPPCAVTRDSHAPNDPLLPVPLVGVSSPMRLPSNAGQMTVEVRSGEEQRRHVLNQRLLVRLGCDQKTITSG